MVFVRVCVCVCVCVLYQACSLLSHPIVNPLISLAAGTEYSGTGIQHTTCMTRYVQSTVATAVVAPRLALQNYSSDVLAGAQDRVSPLILNFPSPTVLLCPLPWDRLCSQVKLSDARLEAHNHPQPWLSSGSPSRVASKRAYMCIVVGVCPGHVRWNVHAAPKLSRKLMPGQVFQPVLVRHSVT
ncbi:hypothetical protein F5Y17DRAFT_185384 [Xylariaceae sp. FL0594]|nr:hypothetical protein F5Y17DRAFT_185384 [Xylariaceae sp. FL0594]